MLSRSRRQLAVFALAALGLAPFFPQSLTAQNRPARLATFSFTSAQSEQPKAQETKTEDQSGTEAFKHSSSVQGLAKLTGLSVDNAYWLSVVLNFAIMFIVLWVLARKSLPGALRNRGEAIQAKLEEARKMSEEARQRLAEVEGRLSRLDTDIAAMRREAEDMSRAEEQRVLAAGEEERKRIVSSAELEIETAANLARRDLKAYAAELAVNLAQQKIHISPDTDQALVHQFTMRLGKDGE